jgi:UDP-N-acetylmuramate: L-alanyl-gamma-D-glutamyl-meso-diaminopimelate ligase
MAGKEIQIAVIYPSGPMKCEPEKMEQRIHIIEAAGYKIHNLSLFHPGTEGVTAGTSIERAAMVSHALTRRMYDVVWAARGGYGTTALVPFLRNMLPPILPKQRLIGFSDVSFLGVSIALAYPEVTYVHGRNIFSDDLFNCDPVENTILSALIDGGTPPPTDFSATPLANCEAQTTIEGLVVPMNLCMAESLAAFHEAKLPANSILFLEDVNEPLYRLLRKFDNLVNAGLLANVQALVLGDFSNCEGPNGTSITALELGSALANRTKLPIFSFPSFGHGAARLPLVCLSRASLATKGSAATLTLGFDRVHHQPVCNIYRPDGAESHLRIHFTGIGGTGMAAVAGIFKSAGFNLTGSDTPIFPPMDKVIADMGITPCVNYEAKNITETKPDVVVLSNVISRKNAALQGNAELEEILEHNVPMLSFPSALRRFFLNKARNIVVTGTHGKTTTTSLITQTLTHMDLNPSLFVGGAPKNFGSGFRLGSPELFVLEGDEYDTAFFDKGPKFMHYEPTIALINNIEFDHADIYADIEAIEAEFRRLTHLTAQRGGIVVANYTENRVAKIANNSPAPVLGFGWENTKCELPCWRVLRHITVTTGTVLEVKAPWGQRIQVETQIFGRHNVLNGGATLASIHAYLIARQNNFKPMTQEEFTRAASEPLERDLVTCMAAGMGSFEGVKRRFELIGVASDIAVFDDFAHHPTAINTTLEAFRSYMQAAGRRGKLIACFDPRNATMRRRVLQEDLARAFGHADKVLLGKVPQDLRLAENERLDGPGLAQTIGPKASYFDDNETLFEHLAKTLQSGDTLVFMGPSGAFPGIPQRLTKTLAQRSS